MNKIEIKKRNGMTILCLYSQKLQQVDLSELELLKTRTADGLLPATAHEDGKKFILVYNITGYLSLRDYLRTPIDRQHFISIVRQFTDIFQCLREQGYNTQKLLLDLNHVMIHSTAKTINFIYIPIQYYNNQTPIKSLYLDIAYKAAFSQLENTDYVHDYISIIQRGANFSVYELDEYLAKNMDQPAVSSNNNATCDVTPYADNESDNPLSFTYDGLGMTPAPAYKNNDVVRMPFLLRQSTGEKILVASPRFSLGRDPEKSDFAINNRAISGCHAVITQEGIRYYITDLGSLNHTYIDDRELAAHEKTEIQPGMRIDLADEVFTFDLK